MKKFVGIILAAAMALSCFGGVVFADTEAEGLASSVKQRLEIPKDYASLTTEKFSSKTGEILRLEWQNTEDKTFISAEVTADGIITYYYNSAVKNNKGLSKFTKEEAIEIAKRWFNKVNPEAKEYIFDLEEIYMGYGMSLSAQRYVNGARVEGDGLTVRINSQTGEISDMSLGYTKYEFNAPENIISEEAAKEGFGKNTNLILAYLKRESEAIPVYIDYEEMYMPAFGIDAVSGEKVIIEKDYLRGYDTESSKDTAFNEMAADGLSQQEIAELSKYDSYISPENALKKLTAIKEFNLSGYEIERYSYTKRYNAKDEDNADEVMLSLTLRNENGYANAGFDARTGEVLSFFCNPNNEQRVEKINSAKADEIADSLIKRLCKDKTVTKAVQKDNAESITREIIYLEEIDGIPYINSQAAVTVDKSTGFVTNYTAEFEKEDITFKKPNNGLTPDDAMNKYIALSDYGLIYVDISKEGEPYNYALVYSRENAPCCIDAQDGKRLTKSGEAEKEPLKAYSDLEGHWAKRIINSLIENGYLTVEEECFRPNDSITFGEAQKMLGGAGLYYSLGDKEKDEIMTREDAIKAVICGTGYEKAGILSDIYKPVFSDWESIAVEKRGYVALAKGFGIINGDQNGSFNPKAYMSRSAFASVIYNCISSEITDK